MKIDVIDENYFPESESQFDFIYNPDGSCHFWYCGRPGVVLVYDDMVPEFAYWMCAECWAGYADLPMFVIVKDNRPQAIERPGEP